MGDVSKKIITESIWKFLSSLVIKVGALVFVVLLARFLKPEGFGIYNLAMSVVLFFALLADMGINKAFLRYVSFSLGKKDKSQAAAYTKYLFKLKLITLTLSAALLFLLAYPLAFFMFKKPELFIPLIIISIYLAVISIERFLEYFFYVLKKVKFITAKETAFQILRIALALIVFFFFADQWRVIGVLLALIVANSIVTFSMFLIIRKKAKFLFKKTKAKVDTRKIFRFVKYLAIGGLSTMFFIYIDTIMLGIFLPAEYVGFYSSAVGLIASLIVLVSVPNILLPIFTQFKRFQLKKAFDKVFRYICILSMPLIFGALVLGRYVIRAFYGYEYLPAAIPFYFLSVLIFSGVLTDMLVALFSAREKPKYFVNVLIFASILNVILNYILITTFMAISLEWAMIGAASATIFSRYLYMASLMFIANKKLRVSFKASYFARTFAAGVIMFGVLYWINMSMIVDMTLWIGLLEIALGAVIYFSILLLTETLTEEDFIMIMEIIQRKNPKQIKNKIRTE